MIDKIFHLTKGVSKMKNRVEDDVAVKFAIKHIKEIIEMIGKVKLVFPAYKAIEEELRE